jgi:hypothetical protein
MLAILESMLLVSMALADDFKSINGKEYKNVTVSRVEADGIVLKGKSGISKVYFGELPKEVQQRFHYSPEGADKAREDAPASSLHTSAFASGATACLDFTTAKPALDSAAGSLDASVRAGKKEGSGQFAHGSALPLGRKVSRFRYSKVL